MKEAGVTKEEVLYVGDSGVDMQTAVNSGVTSIGVTWGFRDREELLANGAQYIADEPWRDYEVGSLVNGVEVKYL